MESRRSFLKRGFAVGALAGFALRDGWVEAARAAQKKAAGRSPQELAGDEDFWFQVQQAFTVDRSIINLNNGGISPSPQVVQDAMRRHLEYSQSAPARNIWGVLNPQVETVRERLAHLFGCSPEELALTRNASESLAICINGMDLKPGDEALTTDHDYPRMITTYKQRERREGIKLVTVPCPAPPESMAQLVELFRKGITPKTRVMLCSHVTFVTGQVFPVREICRLGRERGIPVIVDGAHSFAQLAFRRDDLECEYFGNSLHKWLTGPHGTGFLYVRRDRIKPLWPLMAAPDKLDDDIRKFEEIGTHPAANKLAIAEAITFHEAIGPERREMRLRFLRDRWAKRLAADKRVKFFTRLEPEHSCAVATLAIDGVDHAKLAEHLWNKHRVFVVAMDYAGVQGIRISSNVYTTLEEIDLFSRAMEEVLANGLPA